MSNERAEEQRFHSNDNEHEVAIIRSDWVQHRLIVMVLRPLTSRLCPVVISWLSARPMHVV